MTYDNVDEDAATVIWSSFSTVSYHGVNISTTEYHSDLLRSESNNSSPVYEPGLPRSYQAALITLYSVTTAAAVIGNLLVLGVLAVGRRSRTDLRAYLQSLAVADLMMATFCMPFTFTTTMLHSWIFGAVMCPVVVFLQVHTSVTTGRPTHRHGRAAVCVGFTL